MFQEQFVFYWQLCFGFLMALALGSFYVTLAERILFYYYGPSRKKTSRWQRVRLLLFHPSSCTSCLQRIRVLDLLPFFGYFISKGKCRHCSKKLPIWYPILELLFGLFFLFQFVLSENFLFSMAMLFFVGHLGISMYTDAQKFSLDYENLPFILGWGVLANYLLTQSLPGKTDFYVFLGFVIFYVLLFFIFPRGIGLGDVLFAPFFALLAGHPWWMFFLNASYVLALVFTFILRDRKKSFRATPIPMGLYFSIGLVLAFMAKLYFHKYPTPLL